MLEGVLSPQAEKLYGRLLKVGVINVSGADEPAPNSAAVRELVDKHFASRAADGNGLVAVAPRLAIEHALLVLERGIVRIHETRLNAMAAISALQEAYERSPAHGLGDHRVRIIGEHEAARLSASLLETARQEVLAFQTVPAAGHPPWTRVLTARDVLAGRDPDGTLAERLCRRGVRVRCIFAKELLDSPQARDTVSQYTRQGLDIRASHALPAAMIMVDSRTALVPLDTGASTGAVMFRRGAATELLQSAFELYWARSVPLAAGRVRDGDGPSDTQLLILRLLAAGLKDEAIARHLRVSLRTVRRNITTLCDKVGAPTRFTLATIAAERGWLAGPARPEVEAAGAPRAPLDEGRARR